MPIYEYQCSSCGKVHELMQKFSDGPLVNCPDCGGPVLKLMSATSFALKGSGWYTTDYKRKAAPAAPAGEKSVIAKPETAKSETAKPETKKTETKETAKPV